MDDGIDPRLLAFLRNPESYPHRPRTIRELHTHASLVFVVSPFVYKIKKPVNFGFLDFSSLEKRRYYCGREVELNWRLSADIYLGVEPLTRKGQGFAFGGSGPVVEYAVKMRELPADGFLDTRIMSGNAGRLELERVARRLADFYQKQETTPEIARWGNLEEIRISTDENFAQSRPFIGNTLSRIAFETVRLFTNHCYEKRQALFESRVADGWIRDCHGDLHLDHVHVTDDALCIHDCIEFNDRFRYIDVANDVAFLAMDLDHHGRPDLGNFFTRRMAKLLGDAQMDELMDFYKCYRAWVRGKVESLHATAEIGDDSERKAATIRAQRYFRLALQYTVAGSRPVALVFMGRVASGKSTLARAVAKELGWPIISSDLLRKSILGIPPYLRVNTEKRRVLYAPEMTQRTYDKMIRQAWRALDYSEGVVLDATFSKRMSRDRLRESLGDARLKWVVTEVDDATACERLRQRGNRLDEVSDARWEDRDLLNAAFEAPDELPEDRKWIADTRGNSEAVARRILAAISTGS